VVKREGSVVKWTYNEYLNDIKNVAKAFVSIGVRPFHGVAIWGFNSPEWFIADIAAIFAGAVVRSWPLVKEIYSRN
jgi:long-chain-fatty-acid--CoA ligase ACSBG